MEFLPHRLRLGPVTHLLFVLMLLMLGDMATLIYDRVKYQLRCFSLLLAMTEAMLTDDVTTHRHDVFFPHTQSLTNCEL